MQPSKITLVLYPNAIGMGYIVCEGPKELIDYGMARIRPLSKSAYIKRLMKFMKTYKPDLVLVRGYEAGNIKVSQRVQGIIDSFQEEAEELNIKTHVYSRKQIQEIFKQFGSITKYGIAKKISEWYPELASRLPSPRKNTQAEDYHMGVFDTFSLMLTHQYIQ